MNLPCYELIADGSFTVFEFTCDGPKGKIAKLIKFSETDKPGVCNLAFGDKIRGDIDDRVVSNNADTEKVLTTVVDAVYVFTEKNQDMWVYATGSTKARTRLYRRGIAKYLSLANKDFFVFGLKGDQWSAFEREVDYTAFLIKRK